MVRRKFVIAYAGPSCADGVVDKMVDQAEAVAADLKGDAPTPIDTLIADAAGPLWLLWHIAEMGFSAKADAIHRRYLRTLRTLDAVRRVAAVVQVNVAHGPQLNVGKITKDPRERLDGGGTGRRD